MLFNNSRPTFANIYLENLTFNFNSVKKFVGEEFSYMGVVKANAYGHGAVDCARALENKGINCLGVALPEEGINLRANGIKTPIICLGGFWEGQEFSIIENNIAPVIFRLDLAERLNRAAAGKKITADIHLKIDSGMGRVGIPLNILGEFLDKFQKFKNLNVKGVMTHLAAADDTEQTEFTNLQISRFTSALELFKIKGFSPLYRSIANSPGAVAHKITGANLVRLGGVLYGLEEDMLPAGIDKPKLKPVMEICSRITLLKTVGKGETLGYGRTFKTNRESLIATVPIGYNDGFGRAFSNKGKMIVKNHFAPVVGRVSMDWTMIDVTDIPSVNINDEVVVIGSRNSLSLTAANLASTVETISYEITCGISNRVPRIFL